MYDKTHNMALVQFLNVNTAGSADRLASIAFIADMIAIGIGCATSAKQKLGIQNVLPSERLTFGVVVK
jgi:hypothetical protein